MSAFIIPWVAFQLVLILFLIYKRFSVRRAIAFFQFPLHIWLHIRVYSNSIEILNQHWLGWIWGKPAGKFLVFFRVKRAIKVVKETLEWKVQKGMEESLHLVIASCRWDIPLMILQGSYTPAVHDKKVKAMESNSRSQKIYNILRA